MEIDNLTRVNELIKIRAICTNALSQTETFRKKAASDSNGPAGYWANISTHDDGSGESINMTGCYLGVELAEATKNILLKKIFSINEELVGLGVEL